MSEAIKKILEAQRSQLHNDRSGDVVFVMFLEPHEPPPGDSAPGFFDRAVSFVVRNMQPKPVMAHVELVVPPKPDTKDPFNFATYIGCRSGWQTDAQNNESYYLAETAGKWRAVPVFFHNGAKLVRDVCDQSCGVEYSLARYLTAAWGVRKMSGIVADSLRSPAHCATLTARVLKRAFGSQFLEHPSAYYGPASLYSELAGGMQELGRVDCSKSAEQTWRVLLHGPASEVAAMSHDETTTAIRALTMAVLRERNAASQRRLATALLRWSVAHANVGAQV